jgi:hypothetical protein
VQHGRTACMIEYGKPLVADGVDQVDIIASPGRKLSFGRFLLVYQLLYDRSYRVLPRGRRGRNDGT